MKTEARFYHRDDERGEKFVVCDLCHHRCAIAPGKSGVCRARKNEDGRLISLVYGRCAAMNVDPIEKKPLFHFLPGTLSMSVATVGCNFRCEFCQNHSLSQALREGSGHAPGDWVEPEALVRAAVRSRCQSMSFTYSEPTVFFEYALDTARLASEAGLGNCFVSNGFMTPEAVDAIAPCLDAINVDLKSFNPDTYRNVIGGKLEGVLETLKHLHEKKIWVEVTTLLVPGMNDSAKELREIARFVAGLSPDVPWHVSRFHPDYKMTSPPPTPARAVEAALEIGKQEGLRHIYCGNLRDDRRESTWCPACGELLISRAGFFIRSNRLKPGGRCPKCGDVCAGRWEIGGKR
ncbi:MAG TPA: AmmeMemoRadiSam system radical SAM enzyme [Sumerlaeia bacterium]|nr:AmmeMemoRadiSam system radical SAM enzyme [Sumerlaeia bacterium]